MLFSDANSPNDRHQDARDPTTFSRGSVNPARLDRARALRQLRRDRPHYRPLSGRCIGLLSPDDHDPSAALFLRAASELGALVSLVPVPRGGAADEAAFASTARVLGRLYDAVGYVGISSDLVHRLIMATPVPMVDCAAVLNDAALELYGLLGDGESLDDKRCYFLQLALIDAVCAGA